MRKVQFTETVLRDANQSLIATRLPYDKFEPILETMDQAGFYSAEVWGGATFDVCLRYLREDPWDRLRKIRAKMPNTKLQMLLRGQNILGYKHYPDDVVRKFVEYSVKNGIDIIRVFDALNDPRNMEAAIKAAKDTKSVHVQAPWSILSAPFTPWNPLPRSVRNYRIWASTRSVSKTCRASCRLMMPIPYPHAQEAPDRAH